tara:strand:+ start:230 stop:643 length:414 start_codon:yes stop_codon:yes gene_type:complete
MKIIFTLLVLMGISVAILGDDGRLIGQAYAGKDQGNHERHSEQDKHDEESHDKHKRDNEKDSHSHEDEGDNHQHDDRSHENHVHSSHKIDHEIDNNITVNSNMGEYVDFASNHVTSEYLIQSTMLINVNGTSNKIGE